MSILSRAYTIPNKNVNSNVTDLTVSTMINECIFEIQNSDLKKQNPNYFYNYEKVSKRRKQKYAEYLEVEYGYKIRRNILCMYI